MLVFHNTKQTTTTSGRTTALTFFTSQHMYIRQQISNREEKIFNRMVNVPLR